jgi:hypothetical protein
MHIDENLELDEERKQILSAIEEKRKERLEESKQERIVREIIDFDGYRYKPRRLSMEIDWLIIKEEAIFCLPVMLSLMIMFAIFRRSLFMCIKGILRAFKLQNSSPNMDISSFLEVWTLKSVSGMSTTAESLPDHTWDIPKLSEMFVSQTMDFIS